MKTSDLKNASYAQSSFMEDQAANLLRQLSDLWSSMAFSYVAHPYEERLYRIKCRAYRRYVRRADITSQICSNETQQIAAAVEREAFQNSGDSARHPAGAPVLTLSALSNVEETTRVGQGGTQTKRIDWIRHAWSFIYRRARILPYPKPQPQQCQRDDIFVNAFCPCPECSKHHDELAGIHHARAWLN